jgi:hypothetical protein
MRNVAFSILMAALVLLQIAVVAGEITHSSSRTATVAVSKPAAATPVVHLAIS